MATQPTFYSEGTALMPCDTQWRLWAKILGVFQNRAGANPINNPTRNDTKRELMLKVLRAIILKIQLVNLIPNGSVYSDQNEFVLTDMEVGSSYKITWGINDSEMTSGVQDMNTPGVGKVLTFTASDSRLFIYGFSDNAPVTATIYKV